MKKLLLALFLFPLALLGVGPAPVGSVAASVTPGGAFAWLHLDNAGAVIATAAGGPGFIGPTPVGSVAIAVDPSGNFAYLNVDSTGALIVTGGGGGGGVSSVSFTGGLISVATPTTTPALTVAGTSGGVPYFSSASTWASSAALGSNRLVLGGGAGAAPATSAGFTTDGTSILTLGVAGTSVGTVAFNNATSGTASLLPPTGALGTYSVTLPNAASTLPIFGQQVTFAGPTAARTVTLLDANYTTARQDAAQTFTGVQSFTSPAVTTSLTTPSTTFSLVNATATTVNFAGGASTALNIGNASGSTTMLGLLGVDGATPSSSTALIVPASTTTVSSIRVPHGSAPTTPVNGDFWSTTSGFFGRVNGATVGPFTATAGGTVTVVSSGNLTSTALVTGGGSQTIQTPSATATMDASGNISTPGSISLGVGGSTAGGIEMTQGSAPTAGTTSIKFYAPASVTSYVRTFPGAAGTGFYLGTNSSGVVTDTQVASTGSGNVVLSASPTLTGTIGGASLTLSSLTSGRVTFAGASGLLSDDSDLTFSTDTLTMTKGVVATTLTIPNGTAPTTSSVGNLAFKTNAWATSFGALQLTDGTANTYVVATQASSTPTNGQVPTFVTGGTITWQTPSGGGTPGGSDTQVQYNNSGAFGANSGLVVNKTSGAITQTQTSLGTTPTPGLTLTNTTAAANNAQQDSPSLTYSTQGWKADPTSASQVVQFREFARGVQGSSSAAAIWRLDSQINGGGFGNVFSVDQAGNGTFAAGVSINASQQFAFASGSRIGYVSTGSGGMTLNTDGGTQFGVLTSVGFGYATGNGFGGAVTQSTSKSTGVTLNKATGAITMNNAALANATSVSFTLTNSAIAAVDVVDVCIKSGATAGGYTITVDAVAAGSCQISIRNNSGGSLSEAVVINFIVHKGAST